MSMFYSIRRSTKILVGVITLFYFVLSNNEGVRSENLTPNKINLLIQNHSNLHISNDKQYIGSIKSPRSRRKYYLDETNGSLTTFSEPILFYFTASIILPDFKNQLLKSFTSFYLLRGPPVV